MTRQAKVEFDTSEFELSHCRSPRGRGSWAFGKSRNPDVMNKEECFFSPSMTFADAKKWAIEQARARGLTFLFVLP